MARFACSLAVVAGLAVAAAADIPPPPPAKGFKRVPYVFVLKTDPRLTGYQFYPFQRLGIGGRETVGDELKPGADKEVVVPGSSSPSVRTGVVAVPDKVMDGLKTRENLAGLLARENKDKLPAGVVVFETRGTTRDLPAGDPRTRVENVVTASPDEKAGVKFTERETPGPAVKSEAPGSSQPPLGGAIAGIAVALAVVTLGLRRFRRK